METIEIEQVEWEDPDGAPRYRENIRAGKWIPILAQLKENPSQWGIIAIYEQSASAYNLVRNLRRGFLIGSDDPNFTFVARKSEGPVWKVYGRYDH